MKVSKALIIVPYLLVMACTTSNNKKIEPEPVLFKEVTSFTLSKANTSYKLGDAMDFSDVDALVTFVDNTTSTINYSLFEDYKLSCSLSLNGKSYSLNSSFNKAGIWTFSVYHNEKKEIKQSLDIYVEEVIEPTEISYTYADYMHHNAYAFDCTPSLGNSRIAVIPVWFTNSSDFISENNREIVRNDIALAYSGTDDETGWYSVKSYYEAESFGKLNFEVSVSPWYETGFSTETVANNQSAIGQLVKNASDWFFDLEGNKREDFDLDENGYLDGVILIYGAPDNSVYPYPYSAGGMWAFTSWLMSSPGSSPKDAKPNVYFWASYDFMYSYGNYATSRTGKTPYGNGDTRSMSVDSHTFIHEMGHCFGLPDYYDYDGWCSPAAGFSMQDYNVGGHDPFSLMALGWAKPIIPTKSTLIKLESFQETHQFVLLSPSFNSSGSPFDEYILLELYTPTGLNELDSHVAYCGYYPVGSLKTGIRIWHVDARLAKIKGGNVTYPYVIPDESVYTMMSNSYGASGSILGKDYYNYNILQLIRNNQNETYKPTSNFNSAHLFRSGSQFDMATYKKQFVKGPFLNSSMELGWSMKVVSISESSAVLELKLG